MESSRTVYLELEASHIMEFWVMQMISEGEISLADKPI